MRPSQEMILRRLFTCLSDGGRADSLLGITQLDPYMDRIRSCVFEHADPEYYFEFPLGGKPYTDMLVLYDIVSLSECGDITDTDLHAYESIFREFVRLKDSVKLKSRKSLCLGTALDLARDGGKHPGFYVTAAAKDKLLSEALRLLGEEPRMESVLDFVHRTPAEWKPYYLGAMPGREGAPLKVGLSVEAEDISAYAGNRQLLKEHITAAGFRAVSPEMLDLLTEAAAVGLSWEMQFEIMQDGSVGSTLGVSFNTCSDTIRQSRDDFGSGRVKQLMELFEYYGIADKRWKQIPEAFFVDRLDYADGDLIKTLGLISRANFAKVKWKDGIAENAKYYLTAKAFETE